MSNPVITKNDDCDTEIYMTVDGQRVTIRFNLHNSDTVTFLDMDLIVDTIRGDNESTKEIR